MAFFARPLYLVALMLHIAQASCTANHVIAEVSRALTSVALDFEIMTAMTCNIATAASKARWLLLHFRVSLVIQQLSTYRRAQSALPSLVAHQRGQKTVTMRCIKYVQVRVYVLVSSCVMKEAESSLHIHNYKSTKTSLPALGNKT
jgi:NAD/NADP transhydrogenase beta subunit